MLNAAKPILEQQIYKILYNAYMTQYSPSPETGNCSSEAQKSITDAAKKFAQKAAGPTAQAIYDFVKEIGINIIIPPSIISPISPPLPGGPCSGTIPLTNITIS